MVDLDDHLVARNVFDLVVPMKNKTIHATDLFSDTENLLFSLAFYPQLNFRQSLFSLDRILPAVNCYGNEIINLGRILCKRVTFADLQPQIKFCIYGQGNLV